MPRASFFGDLAELENLVLREIWSKRGLRGCFSNLWDLAAFPSSMSFGTRSLSESEWAEEVGCGLEPVTG